MNNEGKDNTVGTMIEYGDLCGGFSCNQKDLVPFGRNISIAYHLYWIRLIIKVKE